MRGIDSSDTLVVKSSPVETEKLTAHLYPDVHPNKPGRYRYFKEITIGDNREKILDFIDDYVDVVNAVDMYQ